MMSFILNFLNAVSSQSVDFFIKEDKIMQETAAEFSTIPVMFIVGFIIALIIVFFFRNKLFKKFDKKKEELKNIKVKKKSKR